MLAYACVNKIMFPSCLSHLAVVSISQPVFRQTHDLSSSSMEKGGTVTWWIPGNRQLRFLTALFAQRSPSPSA